MRQEEIIIVKLIASEGYILTNGSAYGREVYLGKYDAPQNWYEITEEQYAEILTIKNDQVI